MYNLSQQDVRHFFFDVYSKANKKEPLTDLEKIAYSLILEHPEYSNILQNIDKYLEYNWSVENGETNPFLHLSMHLSILEQLSIDQPFGIKDLFRKLCEKFGDKHDAAHQLMDCLSEMIWTAQRHKNAPNPQIYFECINKKL